MDSSDQEDVKKQINLRLNYIDVKTLTCDLESPKVSQSLEKVKCASSANEQKNSLDEVSARSIINEISGNKPKNI